MGRRLDLTGQTFGRLTAIEPTPERRDGRVMWRFRCSCGKELLAAGRSVRSGNTSSCGCLNRDRVITLHRKDMAGKVFGRLTVLRYSHTEKGKIAMWFCECSCGNNVIVQGAMLRQGHTSSCGCLFKELIAAGTNKTHGRSRTPIHAVWKTMRQRCLNPKNYDYKYYGAKGVKICARWDSFENFLADMGEPGAGLTLDRIDPCGDYCPENCRWATWEIQRKNRRRNA